MRITNNKDKAERADVLLAEHNNQYSRAALAKLFELEQVKRDNKFIKPGTKLAPGEFFEADLSLIEKPAEPIDLPIIYEDENVVVIDKPAGIISHARGKYWDEASVASFIRQKIKGLSGERAGIVHRLDRATSGVMICAKNSETMSFLQRQFSSRKVKKTYIAVVEGGVEPNEAIINVPILRSPKNLKTFMPHSDGKPSETIYKVLNFNSGNTTLELKPTTGRTHQLRVHLKYINHPILGDELYGGKKADRLYLHAKSLEITIPGGERKIFVSQLPWKDAGNK